MLFSELSEYYGKLEKVSSRLTMMGILSEMFKAADSAEIRKLVYITEGMLAPPFEGLDFGVAEKMLSEAIAIATGYTREQVDAAYRKSGDMGDAASKLCAASKLRGMRHKSFTVGEVYDTMLKVSEVSGQGSKNTKIKLLAELFALSTPDEVRYIARYPIGQLRLGVGDSTILEALSIAHSDGREEKDALENAFNLCSDLGYVAETLFNDGMQSIANLKVSLFRPIRPALAERLPTAEQILAKMGGTCSVEQKYDGFRCQIHKDGESVKIYSRNLEETTAMFPDLQAAAIHEVGAARIIFEGEALAYNDATGEFLPFQETIQRKRKHGVTEKMGELPLHLFAFDVMYLEGVDLMKEPYEKRRSILEKVLAKSPSITPTVRIITSEPKQLESFFESSVGSGLEGIVAKSLSSQYIAGARKFSWIKMKRSYKGVLSDTLDLVIVGYFLGKGNRTAFKFGGLLCAVYNSKTDVFETVSKIGTGFAEETMSAFYNLLKGAVVKNKPARVDSIVKPDFWVEPKYIVTVRADEITRSPMHTCGMDKGESGIEAGYALRFPRIVGNGFIRVDKNPEDATTTQEVVEMFKQQKHISVK